MLYICAASVVGTKMHYLYIDSFEENPLSHVWLIYSSVDCSMVREPSYIVKSSILVQSRSVLVEGEKKDGGFFLLVCQREQIILRYFTISYVQSVTQTQDPPPSLHALRNVWTAPNRRQGLDTRPLSTVKTV